MMVITLSIITLTTMKNLLAALVLCSAHSLSHAQIRLEYTFPTSSSIQTIEVIADNEFKYVGYNKTGRVILHNLDHSLFKEIIAPTTSGPTPQGGGYTFMGYATKKL